MTYYENLIKQAPYAFAYHKVITNEMGKVIDYRFIEVNKSFEEITGLEADKIIGKTVIAIMPGIVNEQFDWIGMYGQVALTGEEKEFEQYSETRKQWYRVQVYSPEKLHFATLFTNITHERVFSEASKVLNDYTVESIDYKYISDTLLKISGARYCLFNKFDFDGKGFTTKAVSGVKESIIKANKLFGFELIGKQWPYDEFREERIKASKTTIVKSVTELTRTAINKNIIKILETGFNINELAVIKTLKGDIVIGDFTLVFTNNGTLKHQSLCESFADLTGSTIKRIDMESKLAETTEEYDKYRDYYDLIINNTSNTVAILSFEMNPKYLYVSPSVKQNLGYSPEFFIGKSAWELGILHPEDKFKLFPLLVKYIESKIKNIFHKSTKVITENIEYRVRNIHNEWIAHETTANLVDGKIILIEKDVTKLKQMEAKIRENEQFQRSLIENLSVGIMIIDPESREIETANSFAAEIVGEKEKAIIGKKCYSVFHSEQEDSCKSCYLHKITDIIDEVCINIEGKEITILKTVKKITINGKEKLLESFVDITERKQSEIMQTLLMDIAETYINTPLNIVDQTINSSLKEIGEFVNADRAYIFDYDFIRNTAYNTYGWKKEGIGIAVNESIELDKVPIWLETHKNGKSIDIKNTKQVINEFIDNYVKDILISKGIKNMLTIPMISNGDLMGFVGFDSLKTYHNYSEKEKMLLTVFAEMLVNIKIRKHSIEQLSKAKEQAETANQAKSSFLSNMSHEIRTPLNGVIGFTDLLIKTDLSEVQMHYAENANISGKALLGIISDILDFSKIEAGKLELEMIKTDMIELIEESSNIIKFHVDQKGLELLLNLPSNLPRYADVDPVRLKQILINLLNNAVKFTHKGEVEISVEFTQLSSNKGRYDFSIRDTGIGIQEEERTKLFKAFSQADSSTTRKFGGTGLGLIISNLLAKKMGARIELESRFEVGSRFYFSIDTNFYQEEKSIPDHSLEFKNVLVIDDNDTNREILEGTFKTWNIKFTGCDNGLSALKLLDKNAFDLLIIDYQMPYMNGVDIIRKISEMQDVANEMPAIIVMHDTTTNQSIRNECIGLGVKYHLVKPIKTSELSNLLGIIGSVDKLRFNRIEMQVKPAVQNLNTSITILIAEDVKMNLQLIKVLILKILPDANILEAKNGLDAVEIYKTNRVDLIFMDVQMPELDGIEATMQIRAIEKETTNHVPVIALTAGALKEEKDKALSAGMDYFLSKPIHPIKIDEVIEMYITKRQ